MGNYIPDGSTETFVVQSPTIKVTAANGTQTSLATAAAATTAATGLVKQTVLTDVPGSFADVAAVRTYLLTLVANMKTAGQMATS